MRGKVIHALSHRDRNRITPAYAGKRRYLWFNEEEPQDHPRLCGEKLHTATWATSILGSPPPMRGKDNV